MRAATLLFSEKSSIKLLPSRRNLKLPAYKNILSFRQPTKVRKQDLAGAWQLTRRGRFIFRGLPVLTLLALTVLGGISVAISPEAKAGGGEVVPATQTITVKGGESLWDIARQVNPAEDPRDVVLQIMRINELSELGLDAGQELIVPLYSEK